MTAESPAVEELDDERNSEVVDENAGLADAEASTPSRLEEEGDVAADYLEELLDIADIDGDIDIEVRNGRTYISIVTDAQSEALSNLVGREGQVLEALQELTRLNVLSATGHRSRLVLDITGYREDRAGVLQQIAQDAVQKVKDTGEAVALKPMGAYERKIVHDAVADLGFVSESEGEGPARHIVVTAAD
ncbi:MAG: RNA-binding protein [Renibacterium salmoninarum]|nr:RNA-binding protein [Renibacterium salmoninarum]